MDKLKEIEIIKVAMFNYLTNQEETLRLLQESGKDASGLIEWRRDTADVYSKVCEKYWNLKWQRDEESEEDTV
ncbi:hypothetical protein N374_gp046 [Bacillus phage phiNIT1]|jgi:hypothetical protein|uniref:SRCR domain-containing protein n=1 Tax=Bacillus phage phiNIT1 TaxID=207656 RepID=S6ANB4_9CAUD|nr:hypothetical protein N374_gp046 [Bacillus phage phiNIT1]BAN59508.1 hypothetical protein [Bacillus phage phiNIT1]